MRTMTTVYCTLPTSGLLLSGCAGEPQGHREADGTDSLSSSAPAPSPTEASRGDGWALERWVPELARYDSDTECAWEALDEAGSDSDYSIDVSAAAALLFRAAGGVRDELSDRIFLYGQPPDELSARVTSLLTLANEARRAGKRASDACLPEGNSDTPKVSTECRNAAGGAQAAGMALERELMSLGSLVAVDDSGLDVDCRF